MNSELSTYVRARYTLVYLLSVEEDRVISELTELARELSRGLVLWTQVSGLRRPGAPPVPEADQHRGDPIGALEAVRTLPDDALVVFLDFHPFLEDHTVV